MSTKRPRLTRPLRSSVRLKHFKTKTNYWRKRLFKAVYSYKGKRVSSKNWSVKIQHLGERRTISLCAHDAAQAAKEASRLYQSVVKNGWKNFLQTRGEISADGQRDESTSLEAQKFDENYWAEKLIHRQHTIHLHLKAVNELSVRIDHGGAAHYFPLQTNNRKVAARRALRIFERVRNYGWEKAFAKFPRELTLAFRWSDSPLAWTYTTFYTGTNPSEKSAAPRANRAKEKLIVAVAESDAGIRQALVLWINRMERFRCVASFSSVPETMAQLKSGGIQFLLGSHNLVSESNLFSEQLKNAAPEITCLLYSTYEDSEELFRATPGGSGVYLLKRTPPLKFLEPIEASVKKGNFSPARIAPEIWSYFKQTVASLPVQNSDRALTRLTRREHEVLALLGKGFPDKEIADRLHISIWTVNGHMKNIFEKLDVHNRTEAVLRFLQK